MYYLFLNCLVTWLPVNRAEITCSTVQTFDGAKENRMSQDHSSETAGRNSCWIQLWWECRGWVQCGGNVPRVTFSPPSVEWFNQRLSQWPRIEQDARTREGGEEVSVNAHLYMYQDRLPIQKGTSDGAKLPSLSLYEWPAHLYCDWPRDWKSPAVVELWVKFRNVNSRFH